MFFTLQENSENSEICKKCHVDAESLDTLQALAPGENQNKK
jgi:hypothetical protein